MNSPGSKRYKILSFVGAVILSFILLIISGFIARALYGDYSKEIINFSNNISVVVGTFTIGVITFIILSRKIKSLRLITKWLVAFWILEAFLSFGIYNSLI